MTSPTKTIFLSKKDQKDARRFATKRVEQNMALYEKRGGFKKEDLISGAMAELAVYKLLQEKGIDVGKPDFTIHTTRRKSYDADLSDSVHSFHVKGQTLESRQRYGASWIMQRTDPIINHPLLLHYLVPCTVDIDTGRVEIYGIMSIKSLVLQGCIGECKLEWFRKTKVALYLDHIDGILSDKARWSALKKIPNRMKRRNNV